MTSNAKFVVLISICVRALTVANHTFEAKGRLVDRALKARLFSSVDLDQTMHEKAGQKKLPFCCSCPGCDGCAPLSQDETKHAILTIVQDCCGYCEGPKPSLFAPPTPRPPPPRHVRHATPSPTASPSLPSPQPPTVTYPMLGTKSGLIYELLGWGGLLPALYLFLFPLEVVRTIVKDTKTSDFSDTPYVLAMMNCALWILYLSQTVGELHPFVTNIIGFMLELCWIASFGFYHTNADRMKLLLKCAIVAAFVFAIAILARRSEDEKRFLGKTCAVVNILLYALPLSAMAMVIRSRSVEAMPLVLTAVTLLCCVFWAVYALWVGDPYIGWPSNLGILFGVVQVVLYSSYWTGDTGIGRSVSPVAAEPLVSGGGRSPRS